MPSNTVELIFRGKNQVKPVVAAVNRDLANMSKIATAAKGAIAGIVAGGIAISAKQAFDAIRAVTDEVSNLYDTSRKLGIGIEPLQELRFVASQTGVDMAALEGSVGIFTRKVGEMAVKMKGPLFDAFRAMNIEIRNQDGSIRSVEAMLIDYLRGLAQIEDATTRNAVAARGFGRSGAQMALMVEGGARSLDEMRQTARDLGIVLEDGLVKETEALGDKLSIASQVIETQFRRALLGLTPVITGVMGKMAELAQFVGKIALLKGDIAGLEFMDADALVGKAGIVKERIDETANAISIYTEELARAQKQRRVYSADTEKFRTETERELEAKIKQSQTDLSRLEALQSRIDQAVSDPTGRFRNVVSGSQADALRQEQAAKAKAAAEAAKLQQQLGGGTSSKEAQKSASKLADLTVQLERDVQKLGNTSEFTRARLDAMFAFQDATKEAAGNTRALAVAAERYTLTLEEIARAEAKVRTEQDAQNASALRLAQQRQAQASALLAIPANANPTEAALLKLQADTYSKQLDALYAFQEAQADVAADEVATDSDKYVRMTANRQAFEADMVILARESSDERARILEEESAGWRDLFRIDFEQVGIRAVENLGNTVSDVFTRIATKQTEVKEGIKELIAAMGGTALNELAQIGFKAAGGAILKFFDPNQGTNAQQNPQQQAAGLANQAANTMLQAANQQVGAGGNMVSAAVQTATSIAQQIAGATTEMVAATQNQVAGTLMVQAASLNLTAAGQMMAAAAQMVAAGVVSSVPGFADGGWIKPGREGLAYLHGDEFVAGNRELGKAVQSAVEGSGGRGIVLQINVSGSRVSTQATGARSDDDRAQAKRWEAAGRELLVREMRPGGLLENMRRRR